MVRLSKRQAAELLARLPPTRRPRPRAEDAPAVLLPQAPPGLPPLREWPYPLPLERVVADLAHEGNPLGKGRPRLGKGGNVYTPKDTREYEAGVREALLAACRFREPDAASCFGLRCRFFRGDRRRVDTDNLIKAICDAANKAVWADDSQVVEVCGRAWFADARPRAEILVYTLEV